MAEIINIFFLSHKSMFVFHINTLVHFFLKVCVCKVIRLHGGLSNISSSFKNCIF